MVFLTSNQQDVVSVASLSQLSAYPGGEWGNTGLISHGDGDLDGKGESRSVRGEGSDCG